MSTQKSEPTGRSKPQDQAAHGLTAAAHGSDMSSKEKRPATIIRLLGIGFIKFVAILLLLTAWAGGVAWSTSMDFETAIGLVMDFAVAMVHGT